MAKIKVMAAPSERPQRKAGFSNQSGWALDTGGRVFDPTMSLKEPFKATSTMEAVPRDQATVEAEKGEVLARKSQSGDLNTFDIGGKKHYEGGTPLQAEPGDFIFSDFKKLAIGGPILEMFGKNANTNKKFTPAQLAKQYDINKYRAIADDPDSDDLKKATAEKMIQSYQQKLGGLAIVQEASKGFPTGIPEIVNVDKKGVAQAKYGGFLPKAQAGMSDSGIGNQRMGYQGYVAPQQPSPVIVKPYYDKDVFDDTQYSNNVNMSGLKNIHSLSAQSIPTPAIPKNNTNRVQIQKIPTASMVDLNTSDDQQKMGNINPFTSEQNANIRNINSNQSITPYSNIPPYGISLSDRMKMFADMAVVPKQGMPIKAQSVPFIPQVALPDDRASIAAMQSSIANAMQSNSMFGDSSRARGSNYGVIGQGLEKLAGISGETQKQKANVFNEGQTQAAKYSQESFDKHQAYAQQYARDVDTARFNYDQSMRNYLKTGAIDRSMAAQNAATNQMLNMMHPNSPFYIDPTTQRILRNPNYQADLQGAGNMSLEEGSSRVASRADEIYKDMLKRDSKASYKDAYDMAHREMMSDRESIRYNPMKMNSMSITRRSNPGLQQESFGYGNDYMNYNMGPMGGYGYGYGYGY